MAINHTPIQWGRAIATSGTSLTLDDASSVPWSNPPDAGSILLGFMPVDAATGNDCTPNLPSGWTNLEVHVGTGFDMYARVFAKIAEGDEDSFTFTCVEEPQDFSIIVVELDPTDLDTDIANWLSNDDAGSVTSAGNTDTDTGAVNPPASFFDNGNGLAIGLAGLETPPNWNSSDVWTNSFTQRISDYTSGSPGFALATKELTATGSQESNYSTSGSGSRAYGALVVIPAAIPADPEVFIAGDQEVGGSDMVCTLTNWAAVPTIAKFKLTGVTDAVITSWIQVGGDADEITIDAAELTDFAAAATLVAFGWYRTITLELSNGGGESATTTFQFIKPAGSFYGEQASTENWLHDEYDETGLASWAFAEAGDKIHGILTGGSTGIITPASALPSPAALPFTADYMGYDESAKVWKGHESILIPAAAVIEPVSVVDSQAAVESVQPEKIVKSAPTEVQISPTSISVRSIKGGSLVSVQLPVESAGAMLVTREQLSDLLSNTDSVSTVGPLPFGSQNVYVLIGVVPDGENEIHEMIGVV